MNAIKGRYRNGQVVLTQPVDWPEDTEVLVEPVSPEEGEEDWPMDPESVARWLAEFDAIPPLEMTAAEEAGWQAAQQAQKAFELSQWEQEAKKIESLFP